MVRQRQGNGGRVAWDAPTERGRETARVDNELLAKISSRSSTRPGNDVTRRQLISRLGQHIGPVVWRCGPGRPGRRRVLRYVVQHDGVADSRPAEHRPIEKVVGVGFACAWNCGKMVFVWCLFENGSKIQVPVSADLHSVRFHRCDFSPHGFGHLICYFDRRRL